MSSPWRALWRVPLAVMVCAIVIAWPLANSAGAHAVLLSSSPGDAAQLDTAPSQVSFEFNESVRAQLDGVRVFDASGSRVDRGATSVTGTIVSVDLDGDLADGVYVATYRVVSADAHPVSGGIVFAVGDADDTDVGVSDFLGTGEDRPWEIASAAARALSMAGVLVAVGGAVFIAWCHPGAGAAARRLVRVAAAAGGLATLAIVPLQAALATGQGLGALFQSGVFRAVLDDGLGPSTALRVAGLAALALTAGRPRAVLVAASAATVASFPVVGHTRVGDVVVGMTANGVHVGAAAVWIGGLAALALALREDVAAGERFRIAHRFSNLATVSIVVVGAAGLVLAWTEVKELGALGSTSYGPTLLAKTAVVAAVAAAGAYNHYRLIPRLSANPDSTAAWRRLGTTVRLELVGAAAAVAITAVLVNVVPAYVEAGIGQIHSDVIELGDAGSVQVVVDPNRAGENEIHLYFYAPDGRPADLAEEVRLELSKPSDDIGPIERTPFRAGSAHFQLNGNELQSSGRWEITVVARLSQFEQVTGATDVLVGSR